MVLSHAVRRAALRSLATPARSPSCLLHAIRSPARLAIPAIRRFHANAPQFQKEIIMPAPELVNQMLQPDPKTPFKIDLKKTPRDTFDPAFAAAIRDDGTIDYAKFDMSKIDLSDELNFSPIMARAILLKPGLNLDDPFFLPPGGPIGRVPTDLEQATGSERYELLGKLAGLDLFGLEPLPSDRLGTVDDPVLVYSSEPLHYIGCTGIPADSHETLWMRLEKWSRHSRCKECGCVYKMKFTGIEDPDDPAQQPQTWRVDPKGEFYGYDNHGGPQVDGPWQKNRWNIHGCWEYELGKDGKWHKHT